LPLLARHWFNLSLFAGVLFVLCSCHLATVKWSINLTCGFYDTQRHCEMDRSTDTKLDRLLNPTASDPYTKNPKQDEALPKLHKSCDYCRHRKVKCVIHPGFTTCEHCKMCEVECIFSKKMPSKKRKQRSAKIAASVQYKRPDGSTNWLESIYRDGQGSSLYPFESLRVDVPHDSENPSSMNSPQGASRSFQELVRGHGSGDSPDSIRSISDSVIDGALSPTNDGSPHGSLGQLQPLNSRNSCQALKDAYESYIRPFTPFFGRDAYDFDQVGNLTRCCISLASCAYPGSPAPQAPSDVLYELVGHLLSEEVLWNEITLSAVFCVMVRCRLPTAKVSRVSMFLCLP
jgi:hypothetical protein